MFRRVFSVVAVACVHTGVASAQVSGDQWFDVQRLSQAVVFSEHIANPLVRAPRGDADCAASGCSAATRDGCAVATEGCSQEDPWDFSDTHFLDRIAGDNPLSGLRNLQAGPFTVSTGGEIRYRFMSEKNRFRPGGPAQSNYGLWRFTPFLEASYSGLVSARVQSIDASAFGYDAPLFPVGVDVNRSDLLQAYVDVNLTALKTDTLKYRYGRQFLSYGSQHLLSPLEWGNTFRNFEGHRIMSSSGHWTVDGLHLHSLNSAGGAPFRPRLFDTPDQSRTISGIYSTYSGIDGQTIDLYWLWFQEDDRLTNRMDGDRHTIGLRLAGSRAAERCDTVAGTWRWDFEGTYQFGKDDFGSATDADVHAGFVSATAGYTLDDFPWTPSVGGIFYWGSGDDDPTDNEINTVFTLFPLGHARWGLIDNFSGQNLLNYGVTASVAPHRKFTFAATVHWFDLASDNDNLYNLASAPFALAAGERHVGNEVDLVGTLTVSPELNIQIGYFWFLYGAAVDGSAFARPDATQFYAQTTFSF